MATLPQPIVQVKLVLDGQSAPSENVFELWAQEITERQGGDRLSYPASYTVEAHFAVDEPVYRDALRDELRKMLVALEIAPSTSQKTTSSYGERRDEERKHLSEGAVIERYLARIEQDEKEKAALRDENARYREILERVVADRGFPDDVYALQQDARAALESRA